MGTMEVSAAARAAANLRTALEMHEFGVALYAQRLRRENPKSNEEAIRSAVALWLRGAPAGPARA